MRLKNRASTRENSFRRQVDHLTRAVYPSHLLESVAEQMSKNLKLERIHGEHVGEETKMKQKRRTVALPYVHNLSLRWKMIGRKAGINGAVTDPEKLKSLCRRVNAKKLIKQEGCMINHQSRFVDCAEAVVYSIALKCGKSI